jgi:hypothetical protein
VESPPSTAIKRRSNHEVTHGVKDGEINVSVATLHSKERKIVYMSFGSLCSKGEVLLCSLEWLLSG